MRRGSSAGGLMVGYWPRMPGVWVEVLLSATLFVFKKFTLRKLFIIKTNNVLKQNWALEIFSIKR